MPGRPDIALVSLGTTTGLVHADEAFAAQVRAAGATCEVIRVRIGAAGRLRRSMALTDVVEALASRRAARSAAGAGALVLSSVTSALLAPGGPRRAIRFDGTAALNRPGPGGLWQRRRERSVLGGADLLLPWSEEAARSAAAAAGPDGPPAVVLPPPVPEAPRAAAEGPDAAAYAGNPDKRGLDLLCEAWSEVRPQGARLAVGGIDALAARRWLRRRGVAEPPEVEWLGSLPRERWLSIVAAADLFLSASWIEDWGLAQMEALSAGTPVVAVPTAGANAALPLARSLAPELVARERTRECLVTALRAGLALGPAAREAYAAEAARLLEPYREEALRRRVAGEVLPRLLPSSS